MNSMPIDATHDAALTSWVASANDPASDFPVQNLPFGRFRGDNTQPWRIGVAIGDRVLDLQAAGLVDGNDMTAVMERAHALRQALSVAEYRGADTTRRRWADIGRTSSLNGKNGIAPG